MGVSDDIWRGYRFAILVVLGVAAHDGGNDPLAGTAPPASAAGRRREHQRRTLSSVDL